MYSDFLKKHITSQASYVEYGYGQVEPNHLSAQRTGQIYAQLPAAADIDVLENGQFVKYDYAAENGGEVNFTGAGEWLLVYNSPRFYREDQMDCEWALIKDDYNARVYSPYDWERPEEDKQALFYNGVDAEGNSSIELAGKTYQFDDVTKRPDYHDPFATEDPFHFLGVYHERRMPAGTTMVPRCFKTNLSDIFTTNTINAEPDAIELGTLLTPGAKGILEVCDDAAAAEMVWQVVRVYTVPDGQRGVKVRRIK